MTAILISFLTFLSMFASFIGWLAAIVYFIDFANAYYLFKDCNASMRRENLHWRARYFWHAFAFAVVPTCWLMAVYINA